MRDPAIAVLSVLGLLFGLGTLYLGETTAINCPAQIAGQPSTCPPPGDLLVYVGVPIAIILASIIGLIYSLRPSKKAMNPGEAL